MLELGCGLGIPGMIFHLLGGNVVLTDQIDILSQLEKNVSSNFPLTFIDNANESSSPDEHANRPEEHRIQALPLSWSRNGISCLLKQLGRTRIGFDIVINCDCVYEPLYGNSWHMLNEAIDELLKANPRCLIISSMERRQADGIDEFLKEMKDLEHVGGVEKVWHEVGKKIEIYITKGIC
ncbi:hypothetical protein ACHAWF_001561 [Thalassiosira exigua]